MGFGQALCVVTPQSHSALRRLPEEHMVQHTTGLHHLLLWISSRSILATLCAVSR